VGLTPFTSVTRAEQNNLQRLRAFIPNPVVVPLFSPTDKPFGRCRSVCGSYPRLNSIQLNGEIDVCSWGRFFLGWSSSRNFTPHLSRCDLTDLSNPTLDLGVLKMVFCALWDTSKLVKFFSFVCFPDTTRPLIFPSAGKAMKLTSQHHPRPRRRRSEGRFFFFGSSHCDAWPPHQIPPYTCSSSQILSS